MIDQRVLKTAAIIPEPSFGLYVIVVRRIIGGGGFQTKERALFSPGQLAATFMLRRSLLHHLETI